LKDIFNINIYGFAHTNKSRNRSIIRIQAYYERLVGHPHFDYYSGRIEYLVQP